MIAFKYLYILQEWPAAHPRLIEIVAWCVDRWPDRYCEITSITHGQTSARLKKPPYNESGIHGTDIFPHRAADLRTNDLPEAEGRRLQDAINAAWDYGDGLHQVALQHGQGPNRHLHIQVRDETRRRT